PDRGRRTRRAYRARYPGCDRRLPRFFTRDSRVDVLDRNLEPLCYAIACRANPAGEEAGAAMRESASRPPRDGPRRAPDHLRAESAVSLWQTRPTISAAPQRKREGTEMERRGTTRRGLSGGAGGGAAVGVGTFPTYNTGNNVFYGPRGREEYPNDTPFGTAPVDPVVDPDIVLAVAQLDQMSTSVPVDRPWDSSSAAEWDRQTLDTWLRANT